MKTIKNLLLISGLILFASCEKEEVVCLNDGLVSFKIPSKPGTRWIYHWDKIDSTGEVLESSFSVDTLTLIGDSLINGTVYKNYYGSNFAAQKRHFLRRDSSGFIVNNQGNILWNYIGDTNKYSTSTNPPYEYTHQIHANQELVDFQGQERSAIRKDLIFYRINGEELSSCAGQEWVHTSYYLSGVGLIQQETSYFSQYNTCEKFRSRLVEFYEP